MATKFTYVLSPADYNERLDIQACFVCVEPLARSERKHGMCAQHAHFDIAPPDFGCMSLPDGDCIGTSCMHSASPLT